MTGRKERQRLVSSNGRGAKLLRAGKFSEVSINEGNPRWEECIKRHQGMYSRKDDIRSEFARDYNRILHSTAYRRLKHKTQVFFATRNDHICTRIEHVNHVAAVSYTISKYLELNTELTNAIAIGHDLGHAPFGHAGERVLSEITQRELEDSFWHERNSLRFVDLCETLPDDQGKEQNLNLTYAVRDGIISHCGEVDDNVLYPRKENIALEGIASPSEYLPYTWEGCIVKIADKIAYLGRDIEDALLLDILRPGQIRKLSKIFKEQYGDLRIDAINNTVLMHHFVVDLCESSSPAGGIRFSEKHLHLLMSLKKFSSDQIYNHERLVIYKKYAKLVIESIFSILKSFYRNGETLSEINNNRKVFPLLAEHFARWLLKYSNLRVDEEKYQNSIVYDIGSKRDYAQAIIDFISGMTDNFAIGVFNELTSF